MVHVVVGFWLGAYLLGSINSSLLIGRLAGKGDLRKLGSGNPGASNVLRNLGRSWALLVLALDVGRGVLVALLASTWITETGFVFVACSGVLVGNLVPLFHQFRGGKGVATTLGVVLGLAPKVALLGLVIWLLVVLVTHYASVASLLMIASYMPFFRAFGHPQASFVFGFCLFLVVCLTHRENIQRLLKHQESKIRFLG